MWPDFLSTVIAVEAVYCLQIRRRKNEGECLSMQTLITIALSGARAGVFTVASLFSLLLLHLPMAQAQAPAHSSYRFVGDSIFLGRGNWSEELGFQSFVDNIAVLHPGVTIVKDGVSGRTYTDILNALYASGEIDEQVVVFGTGINEILVADNDLPTMQENFLRLVNWIQDQGAIPVAALPLAFEGYDGLYGGYSWTLERQERLDALREWIKTQSLWFDARAAIGGPVIDPAFRFANDFVHYNGAGHAALASVVDQFLQAPFAQASNIMRLDYAIVAEDFLGMGIATGSAATPTVSFGDGVHIPDGSGGAALEARNPYTGEIILAASLGDISSPAAWGLPATLQGFNVIATGNFGGEAVPLLRMRITDRLNPAAMDVTLIADDFMQGHSEHHGTHEITYWAVKDNMQLGFVDGRSYNIQLYLTAF